VGQSDTKAVVEASAEGGDGRWRVKVREATEYEEDERWMVMRARGRGGDVM
jgi:hypothetical protein